MFYVEFLFRSKAKRDDPTIHNSFNTFRLFVRIRYLQLPDVLTTKRLSASKPETDLKGLGHQMG